jgi:arylsulfatase A-like enzyme
MLAFAVRSSVVANAGRILAVWALLLSIENALAATLRRTHDYTITDWITGQLAAVPVALIILIPLAVVLVIIARWVIARRALLVGTTAAFAALAVASQLTTGPTVAAMGRRIPIVLGAGVGAFVLAFVTVAAAPLSRPRLIAAVSGGVALLAWLADRHVLPGLYPPFHVCLIATALAGSAVLAVLLPRRAWHATRVTAGLAITATVAWGLIGHLVLNRSEHLRLALLDDAPVLGRLVFVSAQLPLGATAAWPEDDDTEVREATRARELPRTLDWSGCDILLITIDALRADRLSAYGYERPTSPNIDALASRGARFEHAYTAAPNTSYATTSLLSGRNLRPDLVRGLAPSKTWADHLRELGYGTLALYPPAVFNVDGDRFEPLRQRALGFEHRFERSADAEQLGEELAQFLASAPPSPPLMMWTHVFEPHSPYEPHPEFPFPDPYDSEVAAADAFVGKAVSLVQRRGRCAVFIVTADHGEAFGEHGTRFHGNAVYEEQVRVPLVVVAPGVRAETISPPVQTIDLLPTTLSALGQRRPSEVLGRDLGPLLIGTADPNDPGLAFAETARYTMVATGSDRLICDRAGKTCAHYDIELEPGEDHEIRDRPRRTAYLRKLTAALAKGDEPLASLPLALASTNLRVRRGNVAVQDHRLIATGAPGPIVYGPYLKLPAGSYAVTWRGQGLASNGKVTFSVRADSGGEVLASKAFDATSLPAAPGKLTRLEFSLDRLRYEIEFVVESGEGGRVALDKILVEKLSDDPRVAATRVPLRLAASDAQLLHDNVAVSDDALIATGIPGPVVFGPYLQLPEGNYQLTWSGRGVPSTGTLVFSVRADSGNEVLTRTTVNAAGVPSGAPGDVVKLNFSLDRYRSQIEFVVETMDGARIALDEVSLDKLEHSGPSFPMRLRATDVTLKRGNVELEAPHVVATGIPGPLLYGPYLQLPAGEYELHWRGRSIGDVGKVGFSVTADAGRDLIAQAVIENKNLPSQPAELVRLAFKLDRQRSQVEFVVDSAEGGRIELDELVIERAAAGVTDKY